MSKPEPNVQCAKCEKVFYVPPSKLGKTKSGLYFCSRKHKDESQRLGGIEAIMPSHYGSALIPEYRKKAFRTFSNSCRVCGWDEYPNVLEVNHIDKNRANNSIENLEILCPTHHRVFHYLDKSGIWAKR